MTPEIESPPESHYEIETGEGLASPPCSPCWDRGYNFGTGIECESAECGGELYISDNADSLIYDGDDYECADCGATGAMMVFPDDHGAAVVAVPSEENAEISDRITMKDHIHVQLDGGAMANVDPDCPPETINALNEMVKCVRAAAERGELPESEGDSSASPLFGAKCCCGALATGRMSGGEPRCCATCAFHPEGCRCKYGDPPDTIDDTAWMADLPTEF